MMPNKRVIALSSSASPLSSDRLGLYRSSRFIVFWGLTNRSDTCRGSKVVISVLFAMNLKQESIVAVSEYHVIVGQHMHEIGSEVHINSIEQRSKKMPPCFGNVLVIHLKSS